MNITGTILFLFIFVLVGTECTVVYNPKITDKVFQCEDFDNKVVDCSELDLSQATGEDGDQAARLGGTIVVNKEIPCDYDIEIDVWKRLEMADEYMYNTRADFEATLGDTDAPWSPVLQAMNITSCPVPIESFDVQEILVSLDCVSDVMCHDFCGEYLIHLSFMDKADVISCHSIEIAIVEEEVAD